jgi:hypothetical protein
MPRPPVITLFPVLPIIAFAARLPEALILPVPNNVRFSTKAPRV